MQDIKMVERGEPKSGTTFMFEWGRAALERTCEYLKHTYGEKTCHVVTGVLAFTDHAYNTTFTFDPSLQSTHKECVCENVDL